jgi:four helix bundle suffix protein
MAGLDISLPLAPGRGACTLFAFPFPGHHATHATDPTNLADGPKGKNPSPQSNASHGHVMKPPYLVTFETLRHFFETRSSEVVANIVICLIHQTNCLLDQQLQRLEKDLVQQGGLRESMTRARLEHREQQRRRES